MIQFNIPVMRNSINASFVIMNPSGSIMMTKEYIRIDNSSELKVV